MSKQPYNRTPGGLIVPIRATLSGRVRWQVLDDRGVPEVPRTPTGFAIGPAEGVRQPNLITNLGMNRIAALAWDTTSPDQTTTFRRRLAVGTGSTAPNVADTTLNAEAQRTTGILGDDGGFSAVEVTELDTGDNVWRQASTVTRVATLTADRNLTEFGLANAASADICIRELFRDGVGVPITISLLNGKKVRLDHTLTVEIAAPAAGTTASINIEEYDAGNTLVATIPYNVTYGGAHFVDINAVRNLARLQALFDLWNPVLNPSATTGHVTPLEVAYPYARTRTTPFRVMAGSYFTAMPMQTYTAGTFQRTRRVDVPTSQFNQAIYGYAFMWGVGSVDIHQGGFVCAFNGPATYAKDNTETMRLGFISSWARG